jgi:hypothetical protein
MLYPQSRVRLFGTASPAGVCVARPVRRSLEFASAAKELRVESVRADFEVRVGWREARRDRTTAARGRLCLDQLSEVS